MAIYRSAMGKTVDMSAILAKNEKVRAVGNVKNLNARGDTIDAFGRVIQPATDKISNAYAKTVGNRSANVNKNRIQPDTPKPMKADEIVELTAEELELEESLDDDLEVEKIKEQETKAKKK